MIVFFSSPYSFKPGASNTPYLLRYFIPYFNITYDTKSADYDGFFKGSGTTF